MLTPYHPHILDSQCCCSFSHCFCPPQAFNVINGGSHAGNKLAMQEFMVLPVGAESFKYPFRS